MKGLVFLVTGGASGLGRATVERMVSQGSKAIICDVNKDLGNELQSKLGKENAIFMKTDVTSEDDVKAAVKAAIDNFGHLDVAVGCAGIAVATKTYDSKRDRAHSLNDFEKVIKVNTSGMFNVLRLSAQAMAKNEPDADKARGCMIMTASIAAFDGQSGQVAYGASKGAIVAMTLPISRDLAADGIRCMTICPGVMDTPMLSMLGDKIKQALARNVPFPSRLGRPEEYAVLVESIVRSNMLNGSVIRFDGALRMQ
jgi:3-hydroxyacyl-CoA dehydrogenase/3-hydroxy-2-methylbutyryl-CoA dehydrogenase